jgi:flagellin
VAVRIGSNISSVTAQRLLALNESAQRQSLTRLSSGLRINSAADDSAGLAVSTSLTAKSRVYTQSIRNANDGISALAIADGTLGELSNVVARLKELSTSSANGSLGRLQRVSNDKEASALVDEFNRIVATASFNGRKLLDGQLGELALQLGFGTSERLSARIGDELSRSVLTGFSSTATSSLGVATGSSIPISGDINGDGIMDLISGDDAAIFYASIGNGDGTFQTATQIGGTTFGVTSSGALADVNGDGRLDFVEGSNDGLGSGGLFVSLGNGDGTFQTASLISSGSVSRVDVGDMNGDGKIDIVAASVAGVVTTRLGTGTGTFGSAISAGITTGGALDAFRLGDLNGDGKLDIVAAAGGSSIVSALGTGAGGFQAASTVASGAVGSIALADFNSDGILDIAALRSGGAYVYQGTGAGGFGAGSLVGAGNTSLIVADINGDGESDILAGNALGRTTAYLGSGAGSFTSTGYSAIRAEAVADVNGDGVLDIIGANSVYVATTQNSTSIERLDLTTREGALSALDELGSVLQRLSLERGTIGSLQSRLNAGLGALLGRVENYRAANSRITDVDVAQESAELVKRQIISQIGASVLAQANQAPRLALQLLSN